MTAIDDLIDLWRRSEQVVVLSGAGTSTDSGIPDFRGPNGLWTRDPRSSAMFDIETYVQDAQVRERAWVGRRSHPAWTAEPNAGHLALTALQTAGRLGPILTQNIDGLHQKAGSVDVLELHGTIWETQCLTCHDRVPTLQTLEREEADPRCLRCGGILKTATISFGQRLDPQVLDAAIEAARQADLLVAIGTTLAVMPAAGLADMAKHLAIVNASPTAYDDQADVVVRDPIGDVLPAVARALGCPPLTGE
jgi:NAD-dependent deacetylase